MKDKPSQPDELRMPAAEFDKMMRRAIQSPPPARATAKKSRKKPAKH